LNPLFDRAAGNRSIFFRSKTVKMSPASILGILALISLSGIARAHGWHDGAAGGGFAAGFAHPFTGVDHLLAMLAVGLWSASAGPRPWVAPLSFATVLVASALAAGSGLLPAWMQQGTEPMIAASVLVLGMLVAWRVRLPAVAGASLVAAFAVFHGAAHGVEVGTGAPTLAGLAMATVLLHGLGMALGFGLQRAGEPWRRLAGRLIGGGIALAGLGLGAGLVATLA